MRVLLTAYLLVSTAAVAQPKPSDPNDTIYRLMIGSSKLLWKAQLATSCGKRDVEWAHNVMRGLAGGVALMGPEAAAVAGIPSNQIGAFATGIVLGQGAAESDRMVGADIRALCDAVSNAPGWDAYLHDADTLAKK